MDSRIGLKDEKGAVIQWPEIDITWAAYSRPATMVSLDATHFVIVPAHYANETMIEALRASLKQQDISVEGDEQPAAPKGRKAKRERPDTE